MLRLSCTERSMADRLSLPHINPAQHLSDMDKRTQQNSDTFDSTCIFCGIVAGDSPASVIYSDEMVTAFMDIKPVRPGQCMVVPNRHVDHFTDLDDRTAAHIFAIGMQIGRHMQKVFAPERVGMVVHGYGVHHAHLLIVPQHASDDITSGRFGRVEGGKIIFDQRNIPLTSRTLLDEQAGLLSSFAGEQLS